jgi:hypothetical protein
MCVNMDCCGQTSLRTDTTSNRNQEITSKIKKLKQKLKMLNHN